MKTTFNTGKVMNESCSVCRTLGKHRQNTALINRPRKNESFYLAIRNVAREKCFAWAWVYFASTDKLVLNEKCYGFHRREF